jgi:nitrogen fixation NifU-like protein
MDTSTDLEARIEAARLNPQNLGEMENADAVGTVGSPDCGDMLRMWVKFKEDDRGKKVIDRATFQTFGCQTAIAVASMATELIRGKTPDEALAMSGQELSAPLGPLPPMKIHCAQLVEGALKSALSGESSSPAAPAVASQSPPTAKSPTLFDQLASGTAPASAASKPLKIVFAESPATAKKV